MWFQIFPNTFIFILSTSLISVLYIVKIWNLKWIVSDMIQICLNKYILYASTSVISVLYLAVVIGKLVWSGRHFE